jgi:four helix bundle protein
MKKATTEDGQTIKTFYDLDVWQQGHKLVLDLYNISKKFPSEEKFTLTSQLVRAGSSITCNISEGFSRFYYKDKARFYYHSRGSLSEVQNLITIAKDLNYITLKEFTELSNKSQRVHKLLNGLINATKQRSNK